MCNPAAAAAAMAFGGAALENKAQHESDEANKHVLQENARLFDFYAADAVRRGNVESSRYKASIKQLKGKQRVYAGASNVAMTGTAVNVLSSTDTIADKDLRTITNNAAREAYGYKIQSAGVAQQISGIGAGQHERMLGTLLSAGGQAVGGMKGGK